MAAPIVYPYPLWEPFDGENPFFVPYLANDNTIMFPFVGTIWEKPAEAKDIVHSIDPDPTFVWFKGAPEVVRAPMSGLLRFPQIRGVLFTITNERLNVMASIGCAPEGLVRFCSCIPLSYDLDLRGTAMVERGAVICTLRTDPAFAAVSGRGPTYHCFLAFRRHKERNPVQVTFTKVQVGDRIYRLCEIRTDAEVLEPSDATKWLGDYF